MDGVGRVGEQREQRKIKDACVSELHLVGWMPLLAMPGLKPHLLQVIVIF